MSFDVTTIGEGSLRMSVPAGRRLQTAAGLDIGISGAEANVAGALSRLGWRCGWVSRLPRSPLAERVLNEFRQAGIDLSALSWAEKGRLATLFVEYAAAPRSSQVIFDREHSAFSQIASEQVDWTYVMNTRLLHVTGITASLSPSCQAIVAEAVDRAKRNEVAVSFDVNYRAHLWSAETARETLLPLIRQADLLFCSQNDAKRVFACTGSPEDIMEQMHRLSGAKRIVMSMGGAGVAGRDGGGQIIREPALPVTIIDRIGAGDGLAAGVIHGVLQGDFAKGLKYGAAMAALALSQFGEMALTTREELEGLLSRENDGTDIQR